MHFLQSLELHKPFYIDTPIYKDRCQNLNNFLYKFKSKTHYEPVIGVELEFYIVDTNGKALDYQLDADFCKKLLEEIIVKANYWPDFKTKILDLTLERGWNQFEITTAPTSDLLALSKDIVSLKKIIKKITNENNLFATFLAQPFLDDCGSSLQFNISLCNKDTKKNLFSRFLNKETREKKESELLLKSVAGLCDIMQDTIIFFADMEDDYHRYDFSKNLELHSKGKYLSPTKICWGGNNRTTAIRIPATKFVIEEYEPDRRIEYRIGSANTNPELAILSLLMGIEHGLTNNPTLPNKIHGNAFDNNTGSDLEDIAKDIDSAMNNFENSSFLRDSSSF